MQRRSSPSKLPLRRSLTELKTCDAVVGCVDSLQTRSEIQKFSWRYLVPEIDVGIGTDVASSDEARRVRAIAGHVHVYLPGGPCMWCTGLLSSEKLELDTADGPGVCRGGGCPSSRESQSCSGFDGGNRDNSVADWFYWSE